ncbi:hypothetical protein ACFE04_009228 [Oxalis oulophora]
MIFKSQFSSSSNPNSKTSVSSYASSSSSISSLKLSLPENPQIYKFSDIQHATNNFQLRRFSSSRSSVSWRCKLREKEVIVFQRKRGRLIDHEELRRRLVIVCRSHHSSLVRLLGVSASGNYVYLVYEYVEGANLVACLRNNKNRNFSVLSNWVERMKVASDLAHGLDYIHNCSGLNSKFVHNHIKSSSIVVSESNLSAKICHFGTSELCGELCNVDVSKEIKIQGTRGYMAPELQGRGVATQKCDVFALGIVLLELLSGEEALKYTIDDVSGGFMKESLVEKAREAVGGCGGGVRTWVDGRLRDSFPVEVAEKMVAVGLNCVEEDPEKRPDMGRVVAQISKLYLESVSWAERIGFPTGFSFSVGPR